MSRALPTYQLAPRCCLEEAGAPGAAPAAAAKPPSAHSSQGIGAPQAERPSLGALPEARVVLPPPRYTRVRGLVLLTAEADEAAFPGAPLRAAEACRCAALPRPRALGRPPRRPRPRRLSSPRCCGGRRRTCARGTGFFCARRPERCAAEADDPRGWGALAAARGAAPAGAGAAAPPRPRSPLGALVN